MKKRELCAGMVREGFTGEVKFELDFEIQKRKRGTRNVSLRHKGATLSQKNTRCINEISYLAFCRKVIKININFFY